MSSEFPQIETDIESRTYAKDLGQSTAVSFAATFTAATTFFTGIIIAQYNSFDPSINIPTLMLIISTFGFLYATLVYSNINGMILRGEYRKSIQSGVLGNVLSEYLGVYFIVLAIPLIIDVISNNLFLRVSTILIDILGLLIYHFSGFSIMERHYKKYHTLFMTFLIVLEIAMVMFQFQNQLLFESLALVMIGFIFIIAFFARKEKI